MSALVVVVVVLPVVSVVSVAGHPMTYRAPVVHPEVSLAVFVLVVAVLWALVCLVFL